MFGISSRLGVVRSDAPSPRPDGAPLGEATVNRIHRLATTVALSGGLGAAIAFPGVALADSTDSPDAASPPAASADSATSSPEPKTDESTDEATAAEDEVATRLRLPH